MKISLWLIVLIFLIVMIQFRTTQRPVSPNYGEDKGNIWASIHMDLMLKYPYWYSKTESLVTVSAQFFFSNSVKICFLSIASFNLFLSFPMICLINVLSLYSDFLFFCSLFPFSYWFQFSFQCLYIFRRSVSCYFDFYFFFLSQTQSQPVPSSFCAGISILLSLKIYRHSSHTVPNMS